LDNHLTRQIDFIREVDRLKTIFRQSYIMDKSRHENDEAHTQAPPLRVE
jgi:putative hydrolase of HD superfamily